MTPATPFNGQHPSHIFATLTLWCALWLPLLAYAQETSPEQPPEALLPPDLPLEMRRIPRSLDNIPTSQPVKSDTVDQIILRGNDVHEVLDLIEMLSGKPILRKQDLPRVQIVFDSQRPLPREEALLVLESLLSMNGIALTDLGNYLKAVKTEVANTEAPRLLLEDITQLPPSQQVYARLFQLNYLTTEEVQKLIEPLKTTNIGKIDAFPNANALLVTDALVNLQRIHDILGRIDKPAPIREELFFVQLKNVDAEDLQRRLEKMKGDSLKTYLQGNTAIEADKRTNQLIIITHPGNKPLLEDIIAKLDIDIAPLTRSEVIEVSNAEAKTVADIIEEIITGQEQSREENAPGNRNADGNTPQPPNTPGNPAQNAARQSLASENTKLQFSDYVQIVADERSNAIVAYGTETDIQQVRDLVKKIDVLLAQVQVEVVIVEVTLSDDQVRGIDSFGLKSEAYEEWNLVDLQGPSSGSLAAPFVINGSYKTFSLDAVFRTAKRDSKVNILSAPTLVTTHNQEASIVVGEQRPIITATQTNTDNTSTSSSVNFENIGIELTVKPLIGANGVIQMEIEQKIENVIDTTLIDNNEQPIIGTREAKSFVSVNDGSIIVLGGLQEVETNNGSGSIFLLGDIPIIGRLFGSKTQSRTVRELLLFIKPTIISIPEKAHTMATEQINSIYQNDEMRGKLQRWQADSEARQSTNFVEDLPEPEPPAKEVPDDEYYDY